MAYSGLTSLGDVDADQVNLTPNLTLISRRLYEAIRGQVHAFRRTLSGGYIMSKVPTDQLSAVEICTINDLCDHEDPSKNAAVKKIIGGTINAYMGRRVFQIVEFGGGYNLLSTHANHHHTVEIDPKIIKAQRERGISASTFEDIPEGTLHTDCPRIAPAIYCFHFMNPGHVEQINSVISHDGFFVANCMKTHSEDSRKKMMDAFADAGLKVGIVSIDTQATKNKVSRVEGSLGRAFGDSLRASREKLAEYRSTNPLNNDFWVAAKDDAVLSKALKELANNVGKSRPSLEVWQSRVLEAV